MEKLVLKVIREFKMISPGDKVVVAVSGGPDSMALLNILLNLRKDLECNLVVAHVNHMIRTAANAETMYVENFCKKNGVQCFTKKIDVLNKAKIEKISTEEAGRIARYDFFEQVFNKVGANKIAIAHNANDNAETVLMHIIRGTGITGLKGIEPVRKEKFIRPLIKTYRADIEAYCKMQNLNPVIDESNSENIYTRNKVRNLLIPYIKKEFNPNIIETLNRLSEIARVQSNFIEQSIEESFEQFVLESRSDYIALNLKLFNKQSSYLKSEIILKAIKNIFGTTKGIEKVHIKDIIKLCKNNIGNKYLKPNKNTKVQVNKGKIIISKDLN